MPRAWILAALPQASSPWRRQVLAREADRAETASVRASLLVIAGIGAAGCVALALGLRHIADHSARRRPPALSGPALFAQFGAQLVGEPRLHTESDGERTCLQIHVRAAAGGDRAQLAHAIAEHARRLLRDADGPDEVAVTVRDAEGRDPLAVRIALPRSRANGPMATGLSRLHEPEAGPTR